MITLDGNTEFVLHDQRDIEIIHGIKGREKDIETIILPIDVIMEISNRLLNDPNIDPKELGIE